MISPPDNAKTEQIACSYCNRMYGIVEKSISGGFCRGLRLNKKEEGYERQENTIREDIHLFSVWH